MDCKTGVAPLVVFVAVIALILLFIVGLGVPTFEHLSVRVEGEDPAPEMPIYVINLRKRPDKKEKMEAELARHGLRATFIDAVDGRDLDLDALKEERTVVDALPRPLQGGLHKMWSRSLRRGEVGCYMSHLEAWHAILGTESPYGLVLEDDVEFVPGFRRKLASLLGAGGGVGGEGERWDILYLGRTCYHHSDFYHDDRCITGDAVSDGIRQLIYPTVLGWGNFAYVIRRDTILKLLPHMYPIGRPIDHVLPELYERGEIKCAGLREDIAWVTSHTDSDTKRIH